MKKVMLLLWCCLVVLCIGLQAQQPCIPGTNGNCNGNCSTCELGPKDQLGNSCFICGTDQTGVGYVCRVTGCDYCSERVPICYQQAQLKNGKAGLREIALKNKARCVAQAAPTPSSHQQILRENEGWMSSPSLGVKLPETYLRALVALKDSIKANGVAGTKANPAFYRGYMQNRDLQLSTKWFAINVAPGKWEVTVEKAIYGETVMPSKVVVTNLGTEVVE